jgi:DNA/RNA-binding domain of Phe-tRNA-synthetase-like protein
VGCVLLTGVQNSGANAVIDRLLSRSEADVQQTFADADLKHLEQIAIWRSVFSECGWTPSKYLSSVEAILKRAARGQPLPRISPIVDLANTCSLIARTPIGAHDVATLRFGPLTVRRARPDDRFMTMGDGREETPDEGEVVYASGRSVRTRRWVWRQSADALITPTTSKVFFPIDGFVPETSDSVRLAVEHLTRVARESFGGTVCYGFVDASNRSFPGTH